MRTAKWRVELQAKRAKRTLRVEIAKIPRPTTEPFEARELRRIERRDWKRVDKINSKQWGAYWTGLSGLTTFRLQYLHLSTYGSKRFAPSHCIEFVIQLSTA